jgi:Spy/CpxP family protein refolding chaperone
MARMASGMVLSLLLPAFAMAQGGAASGLLDRLQGNGVLLQFMMMEQPSVQQELRATPEQIAAVRALGDRQRAKLEGLSQRPQAEVAKTLLEIRETSETELKKILTPEQQQRLSQIALQQAGPLIGLTQPQVTSTLTLTADQQDRPAATVARVADRGGDVERPAGGLPTTRTALRTGPDPDGEAQCR